MDYRCRIVEETGLLTVLFPDVPNAMSYGHTVDEALANAAEALNGVLASDVAHGFILPEARTGPGEGLYAVSVAPHVVVASQLRSMRGDMSQSDIAARLGMSYQAYQRLENPVKCNPTVKTLERVAKALGKRLEVRMT